MKDTNPFNQLYVTERIPGETFVELFSPVLIQHVSSLFTRGNVILKGSQGTGKSMLLSLLSPRTRLAFLNKKRNLEHIGQNFIGAEINLSQCGILEIGQRRINGDGDDSLFSKIFADYFNYWILKDLLTNLQIVAKNSRDFNNLVNSEKLDSFVKPLIQKDCWYGYLRDVNTFTDLQKKINDRLYCYYSFHQFNISELPKDIMQTKTSINDPIRETIQSLVECEVISPKTLILINIDQYETLDGCISATKELGRCYKKVIHKALGTRDPIVSYKIGTRPYGWNIDQLEMFGSTNKIEEGRDYSTIDLSEIFRRQENPNTWVFPRFAEDVFTKRLNFYLPIERGNNDSLLEKFFGKGYDDLELAQKQYVGNSKLERVLNIPDDLPLTWEERIKKTFSLDPLKAKLMLTWLKQKSKNKKPNYLSDENQVLNKKIAPWEKTYWKKERKRQALMQLASACAQRMLWAGKDNVICLSGNSILVFLSLCQHIWDTNNRLSNKEQKGNNSSNSPENRIETVENSVQSLAIDSTSKQWYEKIAEHPNGNMRKRFVSSLGRFLRTKLLQDETMSYPGANGFSVDEINLFQSASVKSFLFQAVDYEALIASPHTTKSADKKSRLKFYLNPILSPYFQLPEARQKEPLYVDVSDVESWIESATRGEGDFTIRNSVKKASNRREKDLTVKGIKNKSAKIQGEFKF